MGYHGGVGPIPSPVQGVKGFRVAIATVWVMAVAGIQSLAQELSYDMSMAIKKKKEKKRSNIALGLCNVHGSFSQFKREKRVKIC